MKTKAAILFSKEKIKIIEVEIPMPEDHQVLIKNIYSSVCHTQLGEYLMSRGKDNYLPHCMGHEGVARVVSVGSKVKKLKKNDFVVMSWIKGNGGEFIGTKYISKKYGNINAGPVNTFSNFSLVSENRLYKIDQIKNIKKLTLMGCAIPTAFNSVYNALKVKKNSKVLIAGMGGLGISCLQALINVGCKKIVCVDINKKKLLKIKKLKNVEIICNKNKELKTLLFKNVNKFDYSIDCTGNLKIIKDLMDLTKYFGGKCLIIGNPNPKEKIILDPWQFILGKTMLGAWNEKTSFEKKFYKFLKIFLRSNIDKYLIGKIYNLKEINKAFKDLKSGKVLRPVIKF